MDADLRSIQQARDLLTRAHKAQKAFAHVDQDAVDRVVDAMVEAGIAEAMRLGQMAHDETGFGRPESKREKNLFATKTLRERMRGMKTAGVVCKNADGTVWEVATPMGVVAALIPSTNPTSTAMYKAIISAKARCGIVMSPHPRARACTAESLRVVAEAAYAAGAPEGLFGCMTEVTLEGTDALLEHPYTNVILATGGGPMVRAAYSKGKPAYGVGSGNVPAYVDRSANVPKAAADLLTGPAFDWGTLCSTERSIVADVPVKKQLVEELKARGGYFCEGEEKERLRRTVMKPGTRGLNVDIVGQSPQRIAEMAGFRVPEGTQALIAEVDEVGKGEPLSMETLSPILSFYTVDGWQQGCERCTEILNFGGIGHTLAVHAQSERVVERFAVEKPSMRIVVNTVAALGSVGLTTDLFPAMTLGPGTVGGSITSDNVSPRHLLNIKRLAFETAPLNTPDGRPTAALDAANRPSSGRPQDGPRHRPAPASAYPRAEPAGGGSGGGSWMDTIEARLRERAGNPPVAASSASVPARGERSDTRKTGLPLPDDQVMRLIQQYRK